MKLVRDMLNIKIYVIACFVIGLAALNSNAQDLSAGLVAYYTFECNAKDVTGNGHDATIIGDPSCETGKYGQAYRLNGVDQYFELPRARSLEYISDQGFSWSLWFKSDNIPTSTATGFDQTLMSVCNNKQNQDVILGFGTFQSQKRRLAFEVDGEGGTGSAMSPLTHYPNGGFQSGVWYHVTGIRDYQNDIVYLYVDGVLVDSKSFNEPAINDDMLASIGVFKEGDDENDFISGFFEGMIDDVRIYNRALTQEEAELLPTLNPDQLQSDNENLRVELRCGTDTTAIVNLTNIGPTDFVIKSTVLADGNYFTIENPADTSLKAMEVLPLRVNFEASTPGDYFDTLTVENGNQVFPLIVYLNGRKDEVIFEYEQSYDFDKVLIGDFKDSIIPIANNGSLPIYINSFTNSANFEIISSEPPLNGQLEILPGDTLWITVRFTAVKGIFEESVFVNTETPCGETNYELSLIAEGAYQADIDLVLNTVEVATGDYFYLTITMPRAVDIDKAELTKLKAEVKTNQTITVLKSAEYSFSVDGDYLIIPVEFDMTTAQDGDVLATLNFRATLGMVPQDSIWLQNFETEGGLAKINLTNGFIRLTDICKEGNEDRLIDASQQLSLAPIYPNPTKDEVIFKYSTIEKGNHKIYIINSNGVKVAMVFDETLKAEEHTRSFNLSGLPPGTYFYVLETPTQIISKKMQISR